MALADDQAIAAELRALAEAAEYGPVLAFARAATPAVVLALLADRDRLTEQVAGLQKLALSGRAEVALERHRAEAAEADRELLEAALRDAKMFLFGRACPVCGLDPLRPFADCAECADRAALASLREQGEL